MGVVGDPAYVCGSAKGGCAEETDVSETFKPMKMSHIDATEKEAHQFDGLVPDEAMLDKMKESIWHVGSVLEAARRSAWVAAGDCETAGQPELAKELDAIADLAGKVEAQMKGLYCRTFGMVRPKAHA
jgi:hypothetical protein